MDFITGLIQLVDNGIDPGFAASLAGLSLAAAAFFSPAADKVLSDAKPEMDRLQGLINRGESDAPGLTSESENQKQFEKLEKIVKNTTEAQKGLIKAFQIFVWFVAYTISFDAMIEEGTTSILGEIPGLLLHGSDVIVSVALLSFAGAQLWIGVQGISGYFDVNFGDEKDRAKKLLNDYLVKIGKIKK